MSNNLADWAETNVIDWLMGGATPTRPSARYLALHTGDPSETGASNEVSTSGTNYSRQAVTFAAAAAGAATNTNAPVFTNVGADFGIVSYLSIWDAPTGGNCLWQGAATASHSVSNGDTYTVQAGNLSVSLD